MKTLSLLRVLLLAPLVVSQARAGEAEDALLKATAASNPHVEHLIHFVEETQRGVTR
jgi:hypothetical protein